MNITEYQAKSFFKNYDIPILKSQAVTSSAEAVQAAKNLGGDSFVVKAQVLAGGRGKAGGVKLVHNFKDLEQVSKKLLGSYLVTAQTSKKGELVSQLLIEQACSISQEYYLAFLIDPKSAQLLLMVSQEGGVNIEELNVKNPERILRLQVPAHKEFSMWQAWDVGQFLGLSQKKDIQQIFLLCKNLHKLFITKDASMIEINPLIKTEQGDLIALDGKMSFDENSFFRHEDLKKIYLDQDRDPAEAEALKHDLSFIKLDGQLACMVNGAGLAMATMDMIKLYGANPANFLDVGGGAQEDRVRKAFEIILKSPDVKGILVNIFGGIMKCDVIASALIKVVKDKQVKIPIVIRLEGTNAKQAMQQLRDSSLNIIVAKDLDSAAKQAVKVLKI